MKPSRNSTTSPKMDDAFVNVWLDSDESIGSRKDFYSQWIDTASAKHSDPALICAHRLRKLYPDHSLVSTNAYDLDILSFPGTTVTPLEITPLVTEVFFAPFPRSQDGIPGIVIDQVKVGSFKVLWKVYEYLVFVVNYPVGFGNITQTFVLHEGPEEASRLLLLTIGAWRHELHDEIWVFNQGYWAKDRGLWTDVQKADWKDVILKDEFKKTLQKDVYDFFAAEEVYKRLSIPWKRGLILHGPPGNGKTISLKAILKSCGQHGFLPLYVKSFQSWKGEEGAMEDVFTQARQLAPSVLVLEDLDSLINDRNRSYFLNQLDGLQGNNGLLIIGTTNHFDRLDPGLSTRPSRFDRKFLFDDPDKEERILYAQYWQNKLEGNPDIEFPDSLVTAIAELTDRFSFAYLKEAFISTLVTLAGISGEKPSFSKLLKEQISDLRKQLDKQDSKHTRDAFAARPTNAPASGKERDFRQLFNTLDERIPVDASDERVLHDDSQAGRARNLLDSLTGSTSSTSRVYQPLSPSSGRRDMERNASPVPQTFEENASNIRDLIDRLRHSFGIEGEGRTYTTMNHNPSSPGRANLGMDRDRPDLTSTIPSGSFIQPSARQRRANSNFDASDLA